MDFCIGLLLLAGCAGGRGAPISDVPVAIIDSSGDDRAPAWSPDGRRLAFESNRDGSWQVYVSDASGRSQRRVTKTASNRHPAWSPRGDEIVFTRSDAGRSELVIVEPATGRERVLTSSADSVFLFPHWSPDGSAIAFTRQSGQTFQLYTVAAGGGTIRPLIPAGMASRDLWPRWSPDGERVAFFSRRGDHAEDDEIYLFGGPSRITRVTTRPGHDFCPSWSPDGTRLVVAMVNGPEAPALAVIRLDGAVETSLGHGFTAVTEASWHPGGGIVAFAGRSESGYVIYTQNLLTRMPHR